MVGSWESDPFLSAEPPSTGWDRLPQKGRSPHKWPFSETDLGASADFSDQRILGQLNIIGSKGYARC